MESPIKHEVGERTSSVKTRKELMIISTAKKESGKKGADNKNTKSQENSNIVSKKVPVVKSKVFER